MKNMDTPIGPKLAKTPVAGKMIMPSVQSIGKNDGYPLTLTNKEKRYPEKEGGSSDRSSISALVIGFKSRVTRVP